MAETKTETKTKTETRVIAGKKRFLDARADPPDIRDRMYEPPLIPLKASRDPQPGAGVLDQGQEGACTGFGLAAVINQLLVERDTPGEGVSARMLYEMAKYHDEWPGQDYAGSSCRGAIRGWANMGVCPDADWPYDPDNPGSLTIERAKAARRITLGAYYRLRPLVTDYHAALNEVGAVYVSAKVHQGWVEPKGSQAVIKPSRSFIGGHAFAVVGYNSKGFWVQNSWGPKWGRDGIALWTYEDWLDNVTDGWAVRLALPVPQIFGLRPGSSKVGPDAQTADQRREKAPKRIEIAGHFVHFDDGAINDWGDYWSSLDDVRQTAKLVQDHAYEHLLVYAHGGLNSPKASASRVRALKEGFKRNGIYPFHIMYDTGLAEEIGDVVRRAMGFAETRAGGFTDWTDRVIEDAVRKPVTPVWEEMKRDAALPFAGRDSDGSQVIQIFAQTLAGTGKAIHLAGHSTGAVLIGNLLAALDSLGMALKIDSLTLFAPACRVDLFEEKYRKHLTGAGGTRLRIGKMTVYNLTDPLECDDQVAFAYRKSLLYLVSNALERKRGVPLLGMQTFSKDVKAADNLEFVYSTGRGGRGKRSKSETHGGFDNDVATMNDTLRTILGGNPSRGFTEEEMAGY